MVVMGVGRHRDQRIAGEAGDLGGQRRDAGAGVDHQVAVAAAHEPDVATDEGMDMRLEDQRDAVIHLPPLEPSFRNFHAVSFDAQGRCRAAAARASFLA